MQSPYVSFSSGYDGHAQSPAWDIDSSGVCHQLELDDHEGALLTVWVRTGVWVHLLHRLDIEIMDGLDEGSKTARIKIKLKNGRVYVVLRFDSSSELNGGGGGWMPRGMDVVMCGDTITWDFLDWTEYDCSSNGGGNGGTKAAMQVPRLSTHCSMNGGEQCLVVESVEWSMADNDEDLFILPTTSTSAVSFLPADSTFLPNVPSSVPAFRSRSGHVIVRALINDNFDHYHYFILDTGASGFVIEPSAADALGLESFGEIHITGMAGKIPGKFRRAKTFQIGPLQMKDPVFMEMQCGGLVTGGPGRVIGIIGFEVFRRAIVDIPAFCTRVEGRREVEKERAEVLTSIAGAMAVNTFFDIDGAKERKRKMKEGAVQTETESNHHIYIYHPEVEQGVVEDGRLPHPLPWMDVTVLSQIPHIEAMISDQKVLLMVDTGAGGMGLVLNASAATELGVLQKPPVAVGAASAATSSSSSSMVGDGSQSIRGVGGSAAHAVTLRTASLDKLSLGGGVEFEGVKCLLAAEGATGGVALSYYSSGILCGDLLSRCRLVVDLARKRMAVLPC